MSLPYLGYAVVINNLSSDVEHWVLDVECIKSALDTVGFQVKAYNDCNVQVSIAIGKRLKLIKLIDNFFTQTFVYIEKFKSSMNFLWSDYKTTIGIRQKGLMRKLKRTNFN